MFIQGHHIMDNVVMRLLIPVCTVLRREREEQIHQLALHDMQLQNELTSYQRSQLGVETVIHKNTNYKNSPLYKRFKGCREFPEDYSIKEYPLSFLQITKASFPQLLRFWLKERSFSFTSIRKHPYLPACDNRN